jgi:hypothetical protein
MTPQQSRESLMRHLKVLVTELLKRNKQSFPVPLLLVDLLVENARMSLDMMRWVSDSGSCRCVQRNLLLGHRFCVDII